MTRRISIVPSFVLAAQVALAGCSGVDGDDGNVSDPNEAATHGNSATDDAALRWRASQRRHIAVPRVPTTTTGEPSTSTPSSTGASSSTLDPAAVAAAARTPDGQAIPQPAGPNGQCPDVVAVFGFWSCVTINEQCALPSGATCTCTRTDGEGQFPSWVCP